LKEINRTGNSGWPPLIFAVWNGNYDIVKQLLAAKTAIDAVDGAGQTPLHHAAVAEKPSPGIVKPR